VNRPTARSEWKILSDEFETGEGEILPMGRDLSNIFNLDDLISSKHHPYRILWRMKVETLCLHQHFRYLCPFSWNKSREEGHAKLRKEAAQLQKAFQKKFPHSNRMKTSFCK
jgi:hypothetical protein